ncbi:hypothetical protein K3495_g1512 [Podosphaera aphanis]|nr:hypothetical protein K3495_g1512 [Podosphaera aphanis]
MFPESSQVETTLNTGDPEKSLVGSQTLSSLHEKKDSSFEITDQTSALPLRKIISVFLACAAVDFSAIFDETTIAVALPTIGASIGARDNVSWIALGYFLKLLAIDFFGAFLSLLGSACFMLGLTWGGSEFSWDSKQVILMLSLGILLMVAFLLWQWKGAQLPLLPLHLFKYRMVNGASLTVFTNGWNYIVQVYYIPTFYQLAYGYSPVRAAALMLPIPLVQTFSSTMGGWIVTWRGRYRESIIAGYFIWAIGFGLFSTLNKSSNLAQQICYAALTGFGVGQTLQPGVIALQSGVEQENMAVVTGSRFFIRNLGATFGLAVASSIINNSLRRSLTSSTLGVSLSPMQIRKIIDNPTSVFSTTDSTIAVNADAIRAVVLPAFFRAFRYVFYLSTALALAATLIAIILMPQYDLGKKGLRTEEDLQKKKNKNEESKIQQPKLKKTEVQ